MKITDKQLSILNSFHCERLSNETDSNFRLIDDFFNSKNSQLVSSLQNEAYEEDQDNRIAYYVVKSGNNEIVFFFSLKCGLLYDEFIEGERLKEMKVFYNRILEISKDEDLSLEDKEVVDTLLERARTKKSLKKEDVIRVLRISNGSDEFEQLFVENLKNVGRTFAGVELVHFCANDAHRDVWDLCNFPQKMGTIIFWHFIVPKIQELMKIVGCEYFFLFAADRTPDELLINYYSDQLGFERNSSHCAAIPMYDFTCQFMSQKTKGLERQRQAFFDSFNPEDAV